MQTIQNDQIIRSKDQMIKEFYYTGMEFDVPPTPPFSIILRD